MIRKLIPIFSKSLLFLPRNRFTLIKESHASIVNRFKEKFNKENNVNAYLQFAQEVVSYKKEVLLVMFLKNLKKFKGELSACEKSNEALEPIWNLLYKCLKDSKNELKLASICGLFNSIESLHSEIPPAYFSKFEKHLLQKISQNAFLLNEIEISSVSNGLKLMILREEKNSQKQRDQIQTLTPLYKTLINHLLKISKSLTINNFPIILYNFSVVDICEKEFLDIIDVVIPGEKELKNLNPTYYCQIIFTMCKVCQKFKLYPFNHFIFQNFENFSKYLIPSMLTIILKGFQLFHEIPSNFVFLIETQYLNLNTSQMKIEDELMISLLRFFSLHKCNLERTSELIKLKIEEFLVEENVKFNTFISAAYSFIVLQMLSEEFSGIILEKIEHFLASIKVENEKVLATNIYYAHYIVHTISFSQPIKNELTELLDYFSIREFSRFNFQEIVPILIYSRDRLCIRNLYSLFYENFELGSYNKQINLEKLNSLVITLATNDLENFKSKNIIPKLMEHYKVLLEDEKQIPSIFLNLYNESLTNAINENEH